MSQLEEAKYCRCCREARPVQATLSFYGSVELISCITEHEGYKVLTHEVVLKQMGPLLRAAEGDPTSDRVHEAKNSTTLLTFSQEKHEYI